MVRARCNCGVAGSRCHARAARPARRPVEGCTEGQRSRSFRPSSAQSMPTNESDGRKAGYRAARASRSAIQSPGPGQAPPRFFIVGDARPGRPSVPRTMVGNVESKPHRAGICAVRRGSRRTPRRPQLQRYSFLRQSIGPYPDAPESEQQLCYESNAKIGPGRDHRSGRE